MKFSEGFRKVASTEGMSAKNLDLGGLGLLTAAPIYHGYHGIKNWSSKDKEKRHEARANVALGATELAGLGMLARAVQKSH